MAKRFTDTDKWKRPWFRQLPFRAKIAWLYILDQCDHAGIWHADFELLSFHLDNKVSEAEFNEWFKGKVVRFDGDKYFIATFFEFQYADAKEGFKAKQSALKKLMRHGLVNEDGTLREQLPNSTDTVTEQSGDCPSISIGISKSKKGGVGENKPKQAFDFERLYRTYPRHEGKEDGMKHLADQVRSAETYADLEKSVFHYAALMKKRGTEQKFIKLWSSFIGTKRTGFPWREYIQRPAELDQPTPAPPAARYGKPETKPIRYPSAAQVLAEQAANHENDSELSDEERHRRAEEIRKAISDGLKFTAGPRADA